MHSAEKTSHRNDELLQQASLRRREVLLAIGIGVAFVVCFGSDSFLIQESRPSLVGSVSWKIDNSGKDDAHITAVVGASTIRGTYDHGTKPHTEIVTRGKRGIEIENEERIQQHLESCGNILSNAARLKVGAVAKYVPVNKSTTEYVPPKYDHMTCFIMKSRYNCAHNNPDDFYEEGYKPTDWKLVLQSQSNSTITATSEEICDLPALTETMGGPKGYAKYLLQKSLQPKKNTFGVFLMGDSRLRQIWEALVCAWQDDITSITFQLNGKEKTNHKKIIGTLLNTTVDYARDNGCHSDSGRGGNYEEFYDINMTLPTSLKHCDDDIAMVEFDHSIRFYYINRPDKYQPNLPNVLDAILGPNVDIENDIDQLIFTNPYGPYIKNHLHWDAKFPALWEKKIDWHMPLLKRIQERDIGRWFGADNRWITDIPNDQQHGCMPGFPDDEVNLLLYMLLDRQQRDGSAQQLFSFK